MKRELVKTDKNGTKYWNTRVMCDRCSGGSGVYVWGGTINGRPMYAGTCFKCGGAGYVWEIVKEYTPEYRAKLDAANEKRRAKQKEKWEAERAKREAERAKQEKEREERRKAEEARKAISQYVGEVGKRLTFSVTLEKKVSYEVPSYMGFGTETRRIYIFADENGNKIIWKTSGILWRDSKDCNKGSIQEGEAVKISGTIKGHGDYNGEKQTEIQRVKIA